MRDSNYRSVPNNRAAVTITTSLYDRRALDVTADKPLVNSLNHLTYLVSSSAKVRETLSGDGGIERLVEILHECHNTTYNVHDNIFNSETKLLTAWKWTLAFQCLVLIGTRGTEKIRQKVVRAGMLPIIATVLDNYMSMRDGTFAAVGTSCTFMHEYEPYTAFEAPEPADREPLPFSHVTSLTGDDYDMLSVEQLFKLIRSPATGETRSSISNDIRRRYLIVTIIKKLRAERKNAFPECVPAEYDMDNALQFLSDLFLQDEKSTHMSTVLHAKIAPRSFTDTGVVIPRDDDVVWCLQLLAYISKYPYLKEVLQNTHVIPDMSIRHKPVYLTEKEMKAKMRSALAMSRQTLPRTRRGFSPDTLASTMRASDSYIQRFEPSPSSSPQMSVNIPNDNFDLSDDKLTLYDKADDGLTEDAEADDEYDDDEDSDPRKDDNVEEYLARFDTPCTDLSNLYDSILDAEAIPDDLDRELALFNISDKINHYIEAECQHLSNTITDDRMKQKEYLAHKWNYETYKHFDIDDDDPKDERDYDPSLAEFKKVNLFPMVERFTFLAGTDMYYWSGVIMRNSCRRNDYKGGVRQCGNLECGKWEKYPREFSKCKKCKRTKYCSRDCQMRAWHCHKNWCVPSNSSSSNATASTYDGAPESALTVASVPATLDEATGDTSQVSGEHEAQLYEQ